MGDSKLPQGVCMDGANQSSYSSKMNKGKQTIGNQNALMQSMGGTNRTNKLNNIVDYEI